VAWWLDVDRPALVLGSTQPPDVVDGEIAAAARIDVTRRRTGGGAVFVAPGDVTWVDVFVPAGDPLWTDDVTRSFWWLGEVWAEALEALGTDRATVHRGPAIRDGWSELLCFAGVGSGEVLLGGRKVVGLAQRRTRAGSRIQCAVLHRWAPQETLALLRLGPDDRAAGARALADRSTAVTVDRGRLEQAFVAALRLR
jgi:lipoate-protein ligase A